MDSATGFNFSTSLGGASVRLRDRTVLLDTLPRNHPDMQRAMTHYADTPNEELGRLFDDTFREIAAATDAAERDRLVRVAGLLWAVLAARPSPPVWPLVDASVPPALESEPEGAEEGAPPSDRGPPPWWPTPFDTVPAPKLVCWRRSFAAMLRDGYGTPQERATVRDVIGRIDTELADRLATLIELADPPCFGAALEALALDCGIEPATPAAPPRTPPPRPPRPPANRGPVPIRKGVCRA